MPDLFVFALVVAILPGTGEVLETRSVFNEFQAEAVYGDLSNDYSHCVIRVIEVP